MAAEEANVSATSLQERGDAEKTRNDLPRQRPAGPPAPGFRGFAVSVGHVDVKSVDVEPQTGERSSWKFKRGGRRRR